MKIKTVIVTGLVILATGCASEPKNEEFKAGVTDCAMMCKTSPELKEYSHGLGGGLLIIFGAEEKKCACNRQIM